jgi:Asp-tRNA(Asn)/Glu-tRNA(Gln) amidotransferase A subunit family amidase
LGVTAAPYTFRFLSIGEIEGYLRGGVSARELIESVLHGLDTDGRRLNAVVEVAWVPAMRATADERRRPCARRPFDGIPYGVKEIFSTVGTSTRLSAPPFHNQLVDGDATVVQRLSDPGAVMTAKPDLGPWAPRRQHYGFLGAFAGLPGISVPAGLGEKNLPLGLTIIADHPDDDIVFDVGELYQMNSAWHLMRPGGSAS